MLQQLINHSPDINKLYVEGYDLEIIDDRFLLCHHIPYVTLTKQIKYGTLACALTLATPYRTSRPPDHTIYFIGETPCESTGLALNSIINNNNRQHLYGSIWANFYFSSKPVSGYYANYYDKIRTYAQILSSEARVINSAVTARPNLQIPTL